jgi:uncharacterized protein GlcG (DUF336 family)
MLRVGLPYDPSSRLKSSSVACANREFRLLEHVRDADMTSSNSHSRLHEAVEQPYFVAAITHSVGALVPVPGGVLVTDTDGTLLGAVEVSGETSDHDEEAPLAGVESADS